MTLRSQTLLIFLTVTFGMTGLPDLGDFDLAGGRAWADDHDDDDNDDDDNDDDSDDDDDDDDDRDDDDDDDDDRRELRLNEDRRDDGDRFRRGEISVSRLGDEGFTALQSAGFRVIRSRRTSSGIVARFAIPRRSTPRRAVEQARAIAPEAIVDLSHLYSPGQGSEVYARQVSGLPVAACVRGGKIGLIDTAIADHGSYGQARIVRGNFVSSAGPGAHGTAVASILIGQGPEGAGLVSRVQLFSAAVFSAATRQEVADAIDLVAALDWMTENRVPVVNLSIAGPGNALLQDATERAASQGTIMIAAAGNGGARGGPRYPAAYEDVLAVVAVDSRGRAYRHNSQGSYVDIAAPGVGVWGADLQDQAGALWTGTSFAAPLVTAEIMAAHQAGQVRDIGSARSWLSQTARDIGPKGRDRQFGFGLLQARACK